MSGVVVRRGKHRSNYTVVPNSIARHRSLSLAARGLLVYLLSLKDGTHFTADELARKLGESRGVVRRAERELRDRGYAVLRRERGKGGRFSQWLEINDEPVTCDDGESSQVTPDAARPASGATRQNAKRRHSTGRRTSGVRSHQAKREFSQVAPEAARPAAGDAAANTSNRTQVTQGLARPKGASERVLAAKPAPREAPPLGASGAPRSGKNGTVPHANGTARGRRKREPDPPPPRSEEFQQAWAEIMRQFRDEEISAEEKRRRLTALKDDPYRPAAATARPA